MTCVGTRPWLYVKVPNSPEHVELLTTIHDKLADTDNGELPSGKGAVQLLTANRGKGGRPHTMRLRLKRSFKLWVPRSCRILLECDYAVLGPNKLAGRLPPPGWEDPLEIPGFRDLDGVLHQDIYQNARFIDWVSVEADQAKMVSTVLGMRWNGANREEKAFTIKLVESSMPVDALPQQARNLLRLPGIAASK